MAHELSMINGLAEFAYLETDGAAWHGYGQAVPGNAPIETWLQASNMGNWTIKAAPALFFDAETDEVIQYDRKQILYRSDNGKPLSDVSFQYKVVQPREVVTFFDNIIQEMGFEMATCGVLFDGRKFWAQANIGQTVHILGKDRVDGKLLLATSCDGSMATTAQYTTTRVVCNNTLRMATADNSDRVRIMHGGTFDAKQVQEILGLRPDALTEWSRIAEAMAQYKLSNTAAVEFFQRVITRQDNRPDPLSLATPEQLQANNEDALLAESNKAIKLIYELYQGQAQGSQYAPDTLWQAVNSVTEYCDHHRKTRTVDARVDSAWFGRDAKIKDLAWEEAMLMAA
jgi:phage/plasmid-like protein (TIGR03299 family)